MSVSGYDASTHRSDTSRDQFSAPDLSEIARGLDEDEQRELDADERASTSNNMDDTGEHVCCFPPDIMQTIYSVVEDSSPSRSYRRL